jgi:hypothetical protein
VAPHPLAAEAAADERRADVHLFFLQAEHLRHRPRRVRHGLGRIVDAQGVALPRHGRRVQLDRVVVVARRRVGRVDLVQGIGQRALGVADFLLERFAHECARLRTVGLGRFQRGDRGLGEVGHADQRCGMVGLFLGRGQHQRQRLAVVIHPVVLEYRQAFAGHRLFRRQEQRHRFHGRRVLVGHHQHHAGRAFGGGAVERGDAAFGHGTVDQGRIRQPIERELGRERRPALHFVRTVQARHRHADIALAVLDQRIGLPARHPGIRRQLDRLLHDLLRGFLDDVHG